MKATAPGWEEVEAPSFVESPQVAASHAVVVEHVPHFASDIATPFLAACQRPIASRVKEEGHARQSHAAAPLSESIEPSLPQRHRSEGPTFPESFVSARDFQVSGTFRHPRRAIVTRRFALIRRTKRRGQKAWHGAQAPNGSRRAFRRERHSFL